MAEPDSNGLVPGIHAAALWEAVEGDARNKSGHDERGRSAMTKEPALSLSKESVRSGEWDARPAPRYQSR